MSDESVADIKFSKRFSANLITNIISLIISTLVGLLLVPYFIDTLGEAAYGLIPLATSITSYITLLIDALNTAVSRNLMLDLRKSDLIHAQKTYNTALLVIFGAVLLLLPVALILTYFAPSLFNIGDIAASDVQILFGLIFLSALVNMISANFMVTLFSYNRFDLRNIVTIIRTVIQVGSIVLLFSLASPSLPYIGISYLFAAIISIIFAVYFSRKTCKELIIGIQFFSKDIFRELLSMMFWTLVKYGGCILRSNVGLIIANIICGVIIGAQYSIVLTFQMLLFSIVGTMTVLFIPNLYNYCAKEDWKGLDTFLSLSVRTTSLLTVIFVTLLVVYAPELLTFWVGAKYASLSPLIILLLIPIIMRSATDITNNIMLAKGKFKENSYIYCATGILTLLAAIPSAYYFGEYGIALSSGIIMILCEGGLIFVYTSRLLGQKTVQNLKLLLPSLGLLCITLILGYLVKFIFPGTTIQTLLCGGSILALLSLIICVRVFLTKEDRNSIRTCMPRFLEKHIPKWMF